MPRAGGADSTTRESLRIAFKGTGAALLLFAVALVCFLAIRGTTDSPRVALVLGFLIAFLAGIALVRPK